MRKDNWYLRLLEFSVLTKEISKLISNKELLQEIMEIMISNFWEHQIMNEESEIFI